MDWILVVLAVLFGQTVGLSAAWLTLSVVTRALSSAAVKSAGHEKH